MCEYCGCQALETIDELTQEHERVVTLISRVRDAHRDGKVAYMAELAREISTVLGPHTQVEEHGLFPALAIPLLILQQVLQDSVTSYFAVNERSLRQKRVPNTQLGRVAATLAVVNDGPVPLGALIAGLLVQIVSLDAVLWIAVAGYALSPLVALLSPVRNLRRI